jgi:hypothetical protein
MAEKQFETDKGKRKYQCFVCGVMFESFDHYRNHIIEKHEEGREYIICPLDRCLAPVRDLRLHFKIKHPGTPMPSVSGMARATIWKDFGPKGEKKTKKPKFREGWYDSQKCQKRFHYRSGYEAKIYELLDADCDVIGYDVEPFEIPYIHHGKERKYTPDIIVHFTNGKTEVWEVKPSNQTTYEKNQDKWYAADSACKSRGWEFVVMTETGMDALRIKVKNQFKGLASLNDSLTDEPLAED